MKKIFLFFIFGIFLITLVSAQIHINYYVQGNKVLVGYYLSNVSNLELKLPYDVSNPEVNVNFTLEEGFLKINHGTNVSIKYITKSLLDKSGKEMYFTSKNFLNESSNVKLVLSEGFVLVEGGLLFPKPTKISSDGRNIILIWEDFSGKDLVIKYRQVNKSNSFLYLSLIILFFIILISLNKFRKSKIFPFKIRKKSLTKNLFEDEKRIVEYLLKRKDNESWTKELIRDLKISKVKLSRKLRSLEQKELIKKVPFGSENRIKLIKK